MMPDQAQVAAFDGVGRVVADPFRFKAKLAIGEEAFATLRAARLVGDAWSTGAAATAGGLAASSTAVASTFFGGGWLAALGLGVAATPVGWVAAAAAASGAACYGVIRLFRGYESSRVQKVPAFINTPVDLLGASLFDLMASLALRVAREAGELDDAERAAVAGYFVEEWGLDPRYVDAALPVIEAQSAPRAVEEIAEALAQFKKKNPDCNFDALKAELISFLTEVAAADGTLDEAEAAAIARTERVFDRVGGEWTASAGQVTGRLWGRVSRWMMPQVAQPDQQPVQERALRVPVLWLLGKTGAGKTSLVRAMTGATEAEVGNGFAPCTRTASAYDFPTDEPVMRFLDTRGLGEVGYDPTEDLAASEDAAHVLLVMARLDDPVQGAVAEALGAIRRRQPKMPVLLLLSAPDLIPDPGERSRARAHICAQMNTAWKGEIAALEIDLSTPATADLGGLRARLEEVLPSVALYLEHEDATGAEQRRFLENRGLVLRYAGAATASGAVPFVGTASIATLQLALLTALARRYGIAWDRATLAALLAALGPGIAGRYSVALAARQLASLVPVVGQTVVPALSATWGFASTYALGRVAAYWMHHRSQGQQVGDADLRERYAKALKNASNEGTA